MADRQRGSVEIRAGRAGDLAALEALYAAAFPDEDLVPLIRRLAAAPEAVCLVAVRDGTVVGHVAFSRCGLAGAELQLALLGPLAVAPAEQGRGIGAALVRAGLAKMRAEGAVRALVYGDPGYYGRLGFVEERGVMPPYPIRPEWRTGWQSVPLALPDAAPRGRLLVPQPWRRPELWA